MKKYNKPLFKSLIVEGVNEPVYLRSGDWYRSNCFIATYDTPQPTPENGRANVVYRITAYHNAAAYGDGNLHDSHQQYIIMSFTQPLPDVVWGVSTSQSLGGAPEISPDRKKIRLKTGYMQNPSDNFAFADLIVWFEIPDDIAEDDWGTWTGNNIVPSTNMQESVMVYDLSYFGS